MSVGNTVNSTVPSNHGFGLGMTMQMDPRLDRGGQHCSITVWCGARISPNERSAKNLFIATAYTVL